MANPTERLETARRSAAGKSGSPIIKEPFEHLIQHIKQYDPMLYEALRKLTEDAALNAENIDNVVNNVAPAVTQIEKATFGLVKTLVVGTGLTLYYIVRRSGEFIDCAAKIKDQAPTTSAAVLDIKRSTNDGATWASIFDMNGIILPAGATATVFVKNFSVSRVFVKDLLRIDCIQIGSGNPGKGIEVVLRWKVDDK